MKKWMINQQQRQRRSERKRRKTKVEEKFEEEFDDHWIVLAAVAVTADGENQETEPAEAIADLSIQPDGGKRTISASISTIRFVCFRR